MKTHSYGFIGGGRITRIILQALKNNGNDLSNVIVYDTNPDVLKLLKLKFSQLVITTEDLKKTVKNEVVFIALHPPVLMDTLLKIKDDLEEKSVLISLAPKITIEKMASSLNGFANIARMNPSASTIINKGVNAIAFSPAMKQDVKENLLKMLQPLGYTPEVQEQKIEAYAVISAMGHTYFFFQLQKLKELAVSFGMEEKEAKIVIAAMLNGTSETLFNSGLPYQEVADLVPAKPLSEVEETIKNNYEQYLTGIFNKIKP
jgi:pyrroline-5-carboxylate reductase